MKIISILVVCLVVFCGIAQAATVLALLENLVLKETHSIYFKRLADAGQEVTYKVADDPNIVMKKDDKHLYDHLVIFSPTVEELGGSLSVEAIVEFIDDGGNVMMAGSSRGGVVITDHENLQVLDILTGCNFSSSHNPDDPITEYPNATGKNAELITGLQASNNARVIFSSPDIFSDEKFSSLVEKTGSSNALSAWCFQMAVVVRIDSVDHHLASSTNQSFTAKKESILANFSWILSLAILAFLMKSIGRDRAYRLSTFRVISLQWILMISCMASLLFWIFLRETSEIPVPKRVLLGAILISSGLVLLLPGPFSPFQQSLPTTAGLFLVRASLGAFQIDLKAARFFSGNWLLLIAFVGPVQSIGPVLGIGLEASITFDRAIFLLFGMEVVSMLLALILI